MTGDWWMIWPGNAALSVLLLYIGALLFLYPARRPLHGIIRSTTRAISGPLRLGARWLMSTAEVLRARNKMVLLSHGKEEITQGIEREFDRVTTVVQRDLHDYPVLQRKLMGEITRIEEDYQKCGEVPPTPPEWTKAVAAVAKIAPTADGLVQKILGDIGHSIEKIQERAIVEYRKAYEERHKILKGFMPFWRSLNQTLTQVDRNLTGLQESASRIDAQMEKYEQITANSENAEHALTSSASTQFVIAAVVLAIAFGGAFVNYKLIALPMSAMVANDFITDNLRASDIAALVIISRTCFLVSITCLTRCAGDSCGSRFRSCSHLHSSRSHSPCCVM
jgi:prefoldin subunit 5